MVEHIFATCGYCNWLHVFRLKPHKCVEALTQSPTCNGNSLMYNIVTVYIFIYCLLILKEENHCACIVTTPFGHADGLREVKKANLFMDHSSRCSTVFPQFAAKPQIHKACWHELAIHLLEFRVLLSFCGSYAAPLAPIALHVLRSPIFKTFYPPHFPLLANMFMKTVFSVLSSGHANLKTQTSGLGERTFSPHKNKNYWNVFLSRFVLKLLGLLLETTL